MVETAKTTSPKKEGGRSALRLPEKASSAMALSRYNNVYCTSASNTCVCVRLCTTDANSSKKGEITIDWPSGEPMKEERLAQSNQSSFALIGLAYG